MKVWLRLARVSNLPTVWTNVLAGMVLAGGGVAAGRALLLIVALSLFYTGGMLLNDAFDHAIDRVQRPQRPIPSGAVALETVFAAGFGLLLGGLTLVVWAAHGFTPSTGWPPVLLAILLAGAILFYDWHHKTNPLSPVAMALCRSLAYLTAGYAAAPGAGPLLWALALIGGCHVVGLTYVARQESLSKAEHLWPLGPLAVAVLGGLVLAVIGGRALSGGLALLIYAGFVACIAASLTWLRRRQPGDVGRAVVLMIAAIALLDAVALAGAGRAGLALVALACFAGTLALQRWISGT
jgi:4-hydroxybenzoate polyprenyltransferase